MTVPIALDPAQYAINGIRLNFGWFRRAFIDWKIPSARFLQASMSDGTVTHFEIVGGDAASLNRLLYAGLLNAIYSSSGEIRRAASEVGVKLAAFTAWQDGPLNLAIKRPDGPNRERWNPDEKDFQAIIESWPSVLDELEDLSAKISGKIANPAPIKPTPPAPANPADPPMAQPDAPEIKANPVAIAVTMKVNNPKLTVREVAKAVGMNYSTLHKTQLWRDATYRIKQANKGNVRNGTKFKGEIEAIDG